MEPRIVAALCLSAASATTVVAALAVKWRQLRADRRRRRGIKAYNSPRRESARSNAAE